MSLPYWGVKRGLSDFDRIAYHLAQFLAGGGFQNVSHGDTESFHTIPGIIVHSEENKLDPGISVTMMPGFHLRAVLRRKSIRNSRSEFLQPILMVESAENGSASHRMALRNSMALSGLLRGRTYRRRYSRPKTHVRPRVIEMPNPSLQHGLEVALIERNQKVQEFAAQCPTEALAHLIRLWRSHGCSQDPYSHGGYFFVQFLGENTVPVMNEESIRMAARQRLPELLPVHAAVG